ncbi:MAG: adenylate kinase [Candidatus Caldarchaeum sp.]|nr:adenylate kinase [Candidatus Caldarchaeum sp.]MCX8201345.1 adenylate kinase [Candidatus Caldarchaeum sp.]MDW8063124.1 adenylate kinase [Candidatus Caldarchaeum sp.]MDW8435664.1 adenylate kinase [Candidatus Caldarchaeum sp.]
MKTVVTALPGSGKTTTLKRLVELLPSVKIVNYGDLMFEEASKGYEITHRDEMRKRLKLRDYQQLQLKAAEKIASMDDVVVDTHSVIKTPSGYYPGLPSDAVRIISPDLIVFIECRPEDILNRRLKDLTGGVDRRRETASIEEISYDQSVGKQFVVAAANAAACYLKIVNLNYPESRPFEHADAAAEQIAQTMKSIMGL